VDITAHEGASAISIAKQFPVMYTSSTKEQLDMLPE